MSMAPIIDMTIHCAATPEGRDVKAPEIVSWDKVKFGQASYHKIIELDGTIVTCLDDTEVGAHVHLHNHGNIGVCYVGGTDMHGNPKDTRTRAQKVAMHSIVLAYRNKYPGLIVRGHRDWPGVHKACPSFDVSEWLKAGMAV